VPGIPSIYPSHGIAYIPAPWILWVMSDNINLEDVQELLGSLDLAKHFGAMVFHAKNPSQDPKELHKMWGTGWCPSSSAKLVPISPIPMVYR